MTDRTHDKMSPEELAIYMRGVKRIEYWVTCDRRMEDGRRSLEARLAGPFQSAAQAWDALPAVAVPRDAISEVGVGEWRFFR
ncbi:MAG: hypothetical protein KGL42_07915 [Betaproteobacteria bacterium]|nr:hypothetical protein [Betaproteobacteria bacterium]